MNHANHIRLILAAAVGFLVLGAFGVPVLSYLPLFAILAICPLLMMLMMRGMGHGDGAASDDRAGSAHRH